MFEPNAPPSSPQPTEKIPESGDEMPGAHKENGSMEGGISSFILERK